MAADNQPRSFRLWDTIAVTPNDFRLDAGAYGLTLAATVWGSATLQRILPQTGGPITVTVVTVIANGYQELHLPAGLYRLTLAGVTGLTGELAAIAFGSG